MNYLVKDCPIRDHALVLRTQWGMPLLADLFVAPKQFLELKRNLAPITNKTLSLILKNAQDAQCVLKHNGKYALTPKGKQLFVLFRTLVTERCKQCRGAEACYGNT